MKDSTTQTLARNATIGLSITASQLRQKIAQKVWPKVVPAWNPTMAIAISANRSSRSLPKSFGKV
jgi:hypothetical protein